MVTEVTHLLGVPRQEVVMRDAVGLYWEGRGVEGRGGVGRGGEAEGGGANTCMAIYIHVCCKLKKRAQEEMNGWPTKGLTHTHANTKLTLLVLLQELCV